MLNRVKESFSFNIVLPVLFISILLVSCKNEINVNPADTGTKLAITIDGIEEQIDGSLDKNASTSIRSNLSPVTENVKPTIVDFGDFYAEVSMGKDHGANSNGSTASKLSAVGVGNLNNINPVATKSPLVKDVKYRVILYPDATGTSAAISSTIGVAGSPLSIPVEKGKSYYWIAYSFNDNNEPQEPTNGKIASDQRDLIHAAGFTGVIPGVEGDGQDVTVPVKITFAHKLHRITIEINASTYPGTFTALSGRLGSANYFRGGALDLKTGGFASAPSTLSTTTIDFKEINASVRRAYYYTAPATSIPSMDVNIIGLAINTTAGLTGFTNRTFTFTPVQTSEGYNYTAKIELKPKIDIKKLKILEVGVYAYYKIFSEAESKKAVGVRTGHANSGLYAAMFNQNNFGPNGKVITTSYDDWSVTSRDVGSGGLDDLNSAGYKLLLVSYDYRPTTSDVTAIRGFVAAGGRVLYYGENLEDSPGEKSLVSFYSGSDTHSTGSKSNGILSNGGANDVYWRLGNATNNTILNGSFGIGANQNIYDDANAGHSLLNANLSMIDVLGRDADFTDNIVFFKSKTSNFYWLSDGGFTVYNPGWTQASQSVGNTSYPFLLDANKRPIISSFGNSVWASTKVANSVIMMNLIEKWLKEVQ
ncbi:hypothetical protein C4F49_01600 [Sphingobacterium sp. KB22]|uniref:Uncharacterized protein n=2 Tax=Sphingobacterium hungaricum TaxID=2082723 RepID=A0A928YNS7_9SPHI|nr:hypothetical protein [Sphingobacterium hungaricum]